MPNPTDWTVEKCSKIIRNKTFYYYTRFINHDVDNPVSKLVIFSMESFNSLTLKINFKRETIPSIAKVRLESLAQKYAICMTTGAKLVLHNIQPNQFEFLKEFFTIIGQLPWNSQDTDLLKRYFFAEHKTTLLTQTPLCPTLVFSGKKRTLEAARLVATEHAKSHKEAKGYKARLEQ